jgi:T4 RnlA family RNA ligase
MTHFHIEHIDDVLPHLAGHPEFVVAARDGYTVIDYQFTTATSFDHPARLECRGLKFGPDGRIIARPLHKFFNVGERPDTQPGLLDFDQPHDIMEKLDGSMIHPAIVNGRLRFMTRMGCTDHAAKAERHLTTALERECRSILAAGHTPIFEWTAPDNRVVVSYADSRLTLLAIRHNASGDYFGRRTLDSAAACMCVEVAPRYIGGPGFLERARQCVGLEGFVVRFADGRWVKIKGDDYVLKHKAKESVLQEKNVLTLILRDGLDDVLPLLEPVDRAEVERYRDGVLRGVGTAAGYVAAIVEESAEVDQKTFATVVVPSIRALARPLAFKVRAGTPARDAVVASILKQCGSASGVESVRQLFGTQFRPDNDNQRQEAAVA